jgi:endo-1,4-beta-D-glucanase Y
VEELPGLGKMLMPGFRGFIKPGLWQLNPSYLPLPLLRRFASVDPAGPWAEIARNTATLLKATSPEGFTADWVSYRQTGPGQGAFIVDPVKGDLGSYDAIRVYLWAGITPPRDPLAKPVLGSLGGMLRVIASKGAPPEKVQTGNGSATGNTDFGFSAALLPYLDALGQPALRDEQAQRVRQGIARSLTSEALKAAQPPYYHFVLSLFALGFMDQRYHFTDNGQLHTAWEASCAHIAQ